MSAREPWDRGGGSSGAARPERRSEGRSEVLEAEAFRRRLGDEVRRALEADMPLSLVAIGVSLTPEVRGGPTPRGRGRLLEELGELLRAAVRHGEVVGRLAEMRFGWILPATDDLSAWHAAERVREVVARTAGADGTVAISCGVCELARAGSEADLTRLAEVALRWARLQGTGITFRYSPEVVQLLARKLGVGGTED